MQAFASNQIKNFVLKNSSISPVLNRVASVSSDSISKIYQRSCGILRKSAISKSKATNSISSESPILGSHTISRRPLLSQYGFYMNSSSKKLSNPSALNIFGKRHFSTSRILKDYSESELAHIAAQRQVDAVGNPSLLRPALFTVGVSSLAWFLAEYWRVNKFHIRRSYREAKTSLYTSIGLSDPYARVPVRLSRPSGFFGTTWEGIKYRWRSITPAQSTLIPMVGLCAGIYGLWQFPVFGLRFMYKNFTHIASTGLSRTLLTSSFSHMGHLHLIFNMFALWSFSEGAFPLLGKEYFLATVLSSAVISSFAQHCYGRIVSPHQPSLGASGFVYAIVTYVALSHPDSQALLFFVVPMPLLGLLKGLVVFDAIGLTGVYRAFNLHLGHAAHLGGAVAGATIWWLNQRENRRKLAASMPEEVVTLYNRSYDALIKGK